MAKDILELMLNEEFDDFKKNNSESTTQIEIVSKTGDVVVPFEDNEDSLKGLFQRIFLNKFQIGNDRIFLDKSKFYNEIISNDILETGKIKFEDGFELLKDLINEENFAGCNFINDEKVMNISHPIVLAEIVKNFNQYKNIEGNFIFYSFNESDDITKKIPELTESVKRDVEWIIKISSEFANSDLKSVCNIINERRNFELNQISFLDAYIEVNEEVEVDYNIIPLQILSQGEIAPYFGMALITVNETTVKGCSHFSSLTGNISNDGTVCCGDKNNRTLEGWRTLSKINANSMYFQNIIPKFYYASTQGYLEVSKKILNEDFVFEFVDADLDEISEMDFDKERLSIFEKVKETFDIEINPES